MTTEPTPTRRRWFQFRSRTLFVVTIVVSLGSAWAIKVRRIAERRDAFISAGLMFSVREDSYQPLWHLILFGMDVRFAARIWGDSTTTDDGLVHLRELTHLHSLYLSGDQVTDSGLSHLKGLTQLEILSLGGTQLTDDGVANLKRLIQLQELVLDGTEITDAGLSHLHGLTKLRSLHLGSTRITNDGIAKLQAALPNCKIHRYYRVRTGGHPVPQGIR